MSMYEFKVESVQTSINTQHQREREREHDVVATIRT